MAEANKSLLNWRCAIMAYHKAFISLDIRNNHSMKRFVQKQLVNAQLSYLNDKSKENLMNKEQILKYMELALSEYRKNNNNEKRKDRLKRIELFEKCIKAKKILFDDKLKCKEF